MKQRHVMRPDFPAQWQITSATLLADTNSSHIWKAIAGEENSPVIVKILKPAGHEELRGAYYMRERDGHGSIRLLDLQLDPTMMLLEYAGDYDLKAHLDAGHDAETIRIAADLIRALHSPSGQALPNELQPLRKHFKSLFDLAGTAQDIYADAAKLALHLLDQPHEIIALHGDLHHENIIQSSRGWLAIDPHGLCGDAAFDCANLFYNPLGRDDLCLDEHRALTMAETFSEVIGKPASYILDYAFCYGCLSAAWHREDGNDADEARELKIAFALRKLRIETYP
ncbi:aminoglycoside phosphotransferase family protein [Pseudochrobactrum kiredjianiae]|uniref:Aminoglycoside phosphotransferase family protein n=1 Tax=Pseudochrobactrum kiredjianiae TaxID=386305 RepID=A0ABW3V9B1_9HYPH|nr:aminoglycoside phosphotransferase family protein [Pseudochrobactrum kiredjianiae]MDM7851497.1 aminoglycoside phosphotransferase family protein [Pseudochrobactrum kiredjianiae]